MSDTAGFINMEQVSVGYGSSTVVSDMSFRVRRGEIIALIGENGSGKSTLLKSITKEIPLLGGSIRIDGRDISRLSAHDIARIMAIVMTGAVRTDYFTCYDTVASGRYPYTGRLGKLREEDRQKIDEAMRLTGTVELADRYITDISDGQRQLVMLARAIAQEPMLLILDEPTNFLDIRHKMLFANTVKELALSKNVTVLMSIHELELVRDMADRVIALKDGKIDSDGPVKDILTDEYVKQLFRLGIYPR
ncbi:MAG: ABC transporter ATP-binding protein [Lachnospiraceae bacterium]|nr:ABC transporter ATP-binding protein [Lachnospiraceae bacterium]